MTYTFAVTFLLNIPLAFSEYLCCIILTYALIQKKPEGKWAAAMFIPYCLVLIVPTSLFFVRDWMGNAGVQLATVYIETAGWMLGLKTVYRETWGNTVVTGAAVVFLYWVLGGLSGFFLDGNYDLTVPSELAAYMAESGIGTLLVVSIAAWFLRKKRLYEEYTNFLYGESKTGLWKVFFALLPAVRVFAVELVNEKIILNNNNPMVDLFLLLLVYGVLNYVFRCDLQKEQIREQQASIRQQELYIQNLESVQRDVRIFRHDFKNRMAGAKFHADEGNLQAVQEFISEVTGDFERSVGEKIFQISQLGNIRITELKGLLAVKASDMQKRNIPFRLEAAVPVDHIDMPSGELCRAVGILLDNAAEETEEYLRDLKKRAEVTALFCAAEEGVSILIRNPVRGEVPISRIWEDEFSTKGKNRGTGLTSFRKIVESHENIASFTYQENGFFVQEMKIEAQKSGKKTGRKRR